MHCVFCYDGHLLGVLYSRQNYILLIKYIIMKEKELSSSLADTKSLYIICGKERYLCFQALETFKNKLTPNFPDLNFVSVSGENLDANLLFDDLQVCPFGDPFRVIVVKDFNHKKQVNKQFMQKLEQYAEQKQFTTVLVFFNAGEDVNCFVKGATVVDCSPLNEFEIGRIIDEKLKGSKVTLSSSARLKLINFSNFNLTKIIGEIEKLKAYKEEGEVSEQDIEKLVSKDSEYQVFELTQAIANGDSGKAVEILNNLMVKEKSAYSMIIPLYNNFKRALYISINRSLSDKDLAAYLQIKEFAVKMLRAQTRVFSAVELKNITHSLFKLDENIKQGKIKEEVGLISTVLNILMVRNKNA